MHILMNMLTLWMFGSALEQVWGTRRFLKYYFYCGLGAAACIVAFNLALGMGNTRTIGASGAVYGLLLAFGVLFPRVTVLFMFLFPIQARWMVIIIGTMVFLSTITEAGGPISNIGHLGGMLTGYLLLRGGVLDRASKKRGPSFNPIQEFDRWWREWKLRRARRKFQVYMREQERDRNHRVQ
jgi:membrane associated rhomboid family serine protease